MVRSLRPRGASLPTFARTTQLVYGPAMLRLQATYGRGGDFIQDHDGQLAHFGLFVRVAPPSDLAPFSPVELTVRFADLTAVVSGQVVQIAPGVGVAVSFSADDAEAFGPLLTRARTGPDPSDTDPAYEIVPVGGAARPARTEPGPSTKADKIQLALRGTKTERMAIIRDPDRTLHLYVLKNPRVGIDEVGQLAKSPTTSVEVLKAIAEKREWYQRSEIATALVRNPKTPVPIAVRMLDHISKQELRRLAKSDGAKMPILQAARKKVIGLR